MEGFRSGTGVVDCEKKGRKVKEEEGCWEKGSRIGKWVEEEE